jgi:hypothetical protein
MIAMTKINNKELKKILISALMLMFFCITNTGRCERIKDIVDIHGLRENPLIQRYFQGKCLQIFSGILDWF